MKNEDDVFLKRGFEWIKSDLRKRPEFYEKKKIDNGHFGYVFRENYIDGDGLGRIIKHLGGEKNLKY